MSNMEEKQRISGETPRNTEASSSLLPTVNPDAEKAAPAKAGVHPAFYVMYGETTLLSLENTIENQPFNMLISSTAEHG